MKKTSKLMLLMPFRANHSETQKAAHVLDAGSAGAFAQHTDAHAAAMSEAAERRTVWLMVMMMGWLGHVGEKRGAVDASDACPAGSLAGGQVCQ